MHVSENLAGNLIVKHTLFSKWRLLLGAFCFFMMAHISSLGEMNFAWISAMVVCGVLSLISLFLFFFAYQEYTVFKNINKVHVRVRKLWGWYEQDIIYHHVDIFVQWHLGFPYYNVLFYTGRGGEHLALKEFTQPQGPERILDFAIDVLKRLEGYEPPADSLYSKTRQGGKGGTAARGLMDVLRVFR